MRGFARKHGAAVAIVALLLLDVVLVIPLIVGRNDPGATAAATAPSISVPSASASTPGATASGSPSQTPSAPPGQSDPRLGRLLAVDSKTVAWRANLTGCGKRSQIEVSSDGGQSWQATDSGLSSVVRLMAFGKASVFAIGADNHCKPAYAQIDGPGDHWQRNDSGVDDKWFQMPGDLNAVHDPHGGISRPCSDGLVDLAGLASIHR